MMYKELFSLVTTYIDCFLSSISNPVGEIASGHGLPIIILSDRFNLLLLMAYFKIQLSFPPEAYKNFSSPLNFNPSHDFGMMELSSTFSFTGSIKYSTCVLWPLQVT